MKITVTGGKGGTGKSMVATSLAVELARKKKVTLVDADAECPNAHLLLSIKRKKQKSIYLPIPKWNLKKCTKCGKCASVCKQDAIVFVKGKYPAFLKDACNGCQACIVMCPEKAISVSKKEIGKIYRGENYGVELISGELKLGELLSGEVVTELRKFSDKFVESNKSDFTLIDSAAGIGCPVIASLVGVDYIIAVTEPTPSALHDLKRVIYLADHFKIPRGVIINKHEFDNKFYKKIINYTKLKKIPILGLIPYSKEFINSTIKMKPIFEINPEYRRVFRKIIMEIK